MTELYIAILPLVCLTLTTNPGLVLSTISSTSHCPLRIPPWETSITQKPPGRHNRNQVGQRRRQSAYNDSVDLANTPSPPQTSFRLLLTTTIATKVRVKVALPVVYPNSRVHAVEPVQNRQMFLWAVAPGDRLSPCPVSVTQYLHRLLAHLLVLRVVWHNHGRHVLRELTDPLKDHRHEVTCFAEK